MSQNPQSPTLGQNVKMIPMKTAADAEAEDVNAATDSLSPRSPPPTT